MFNQIPSRLIKYDLNPIIKSFKSRSFVKAAFFRRYTNSNPRLWWFGKEKTTPSSEGEVSHGLSSNQLTKVGIGDDAPKLSRLIALPLPNRPIFPRFFQAVQITSPEIIDALYSTKKAGQNYLAVFLRKAQVKQEGDLPEIITSLDEIHKVGTFSQIFNIIPTQFGVQVMLLSHRRVTIEVLEKVGPPTWVKVHHWTPSKYDKDSPLIKAYTNELANAVRDLAKLSPMVGQTAQMLLKENFEMNDPFRLSDFAASLSNGSGEELQEILEENSAEEKLRKALDVITKEKEIAKLQEQINQKVEEKLSEQQRRFMLQEQMRSIKKELGMEKDDKVALIEKYKQRLSTFHKDAINQDAQKAIEEEMEKLSSLEKNSPEFNVTRSYLDWLTLLPWGKFSEENFDINEAQKILDEDHYGLEDVKQRIIEFIAVGKLKGSVHGKILCLIGPPGVGKTSIGRSIARALNREFYRFSVGGLSDVAEIKGHRRTYIGAMPGKVIQCLKTTQTSNPLILIDEIDKLGRGHQGDPASALLELLDPNQNGTFTDHYLDLPFDVSKALFLCTANVLDTIPGPLADRMEIIRLSGYDVPDKIQIADKYLIPKSFKECGLQENSNLPLPSGIGIDKSAVEDLNRWYCREAGVRNLEKHIQKICRKLAYHAVKYQDSNTHSPEGGWLVTHENLSHFVGKQIFTSDRLYDADLPKGVVMGLAWTSMGGSTLYIETSGLRAEGKGTSLKITGQLQSVMQESSQIAYTLARSFLQTYQADNKYFDEFNIHLHVPEGATPKDGPSAGVTMTTSLLSLAIGKPVRPDIAMTGEISLTGKVLPVGGIKEKTIAARRAGVACLVFPEGNARDFEELPDYLKANLEIHFAKTYQDVFDVAFIF